MPLGDPRKAELTEMEQACCEMVLRLRRDMGLSQVQFARQVGCTERTVIRWEQKEWVPAAQFLVRLKQLATLNSVLDVAAKTRLQGEQN